MSSIWDNLTNFEEACIEWGVALGKGDEAANKKWSAKSDQLSKQIDNEVIRLQGIEHEYERVSAARSQVEPWWTKLPIITMGLVAVVFIIMAIRNRLLGADTSAVTTSVGIPTDLLLLIIASGFGVLLLFALLSRRKTA